jgi:hypothetical protein
LAVLSPENCYCDRQGSAVLDAPKKIEERVSPVNMPLIVAMILYEPALGLDQEADDAHKVWQKSLASL